MSTRVTRAIVLCLLAASIALAQAPAQKHSQAKPDAAAAVPDPPLIDTKGLADILAKHRGKHLMVNFWATWCEPCREEFPMVNELAKQYAPQGLVVVGISLDDDGEITLVRRFLGRVNPVFPNFRKKPGHDETFINSIDKAWTGAIPATFFYAPDGRAVNKLIGEHKRDAFEKAIRELLRHPASR